MTTESLYIRAKDMLKETGIPNSTRADWEDPESPRFNSTFPKKHNFGKRTVYYLRAEVNAWMASRRAK